MPYMRIYFSTTVIACALLIAFGVNFALPRYAYAIVPVAEPCVPLLSWNCTRTTILNPALTAVAKKVIRALRDSTVRWIRTGDFEIKKPHFTTSLIGDPQRIADNAARLFLSELTGINFCNFHPRLPRVPSLNFSLKLDAQLKCTFGDNYDGFMDDFENGGWAAFYSTQQPQNDPLQSQLNMLAEKEKNIVRATAAHAREAAFGGGFLGARDPKTGKIITPGRLIADSIVTADLSEQIGVELVDEFHEALIEIIDTAAGTLIKKGLDL